MRVLGESVRVWGVSICCIFAGVSMSHYITRRATTLFQKVNLKREMIFQSICDTILVMHRAHIWGRKTCVVHRVQPCPVRRVNMPLPSEIGTAICHFQAEQNSMPIPSEAKQYAASGQSAASNMPIPSQEGIALNV